MSETPSPDNPVSVPSVMDTGTDKSATSTAKRRHAAKHAKGGGGIGLTLFMLVLLAGSGGGGYFLWHRLEVVQQKLYADAESAKQQLHALADRSEKLERQVEALPVTITTLQAQQEALEEAVSMLRSEASGGSRTWDVEEIAALLQIANDRLRLEGDVAVALTALEAADRHIEALKNPALIEVRGLLADEIATLRAIPAPDITGMALSLGALIEGIDHLPIIDGDRAKEQAASPVGEQGWRGLLNDFWQKIRSLVVIKRHGEADRALLAPDERYFLSQNLRLNLESARIALLRHDRQSYQQTLRSAREWITLYFDNTAPAVEATLKGLTSLQQIDIAPSLPDISGSLNTLRSWLRLKRQKGQRDKAMQP